MILTLFLLCLALLTVFHISAMIRIEKVGRAGRIHGANMYRLGLQEGRLEAWKQLHKYYEAPIKTEQEEEPENYYSN